MSHLTGSRTERLDRARANTARVVTEMVVATVAVGTLAGVLWWVLAPDVTGVVLDGGLVVDAREGQKVFDRDAIFSLLGAAVGLLMSITFVLRHRHRPVTVVVGLAVLGVGGSLLAQLTGLLLGPDDDVAGMDDGTQHAVGLHLGSDAGLFVWPMVAIIVAAIIGVFREDRVSWVMPGTPPPS